MGYKGPSMTGKWFTNSDSVQEAGRRGKTPSAGLAGATGPAATHTSSLEIIKAIVANKQ